MAARHPKLRRLGRISEELRTFAIPVPQGKAQRNPIRSSRYVIIDPKIVCSRGGIPGQESRTGLQTNPELKRLQANAWEEHMEPYRTPCLLLTENSAGE